MQSVRIQTRPTLRVPDGLSWPAVSDGKLPLDTDKCFQSGLLLAQRPSGALISSRRLGRRTLLVAPGIVTSRGAIRSLTDCSVSHFPDTIADPPTVTTIFGHSRRRTLRPQKCNKAKLGPDTQCIQTVVTTQPELKCSPSFNSNSAQV